VTARQLAEERILAHVRARRLEDAATLALRTFGPEIMSYLVAVLDDEVDGADTFGAFCVMLWDGLPRFRGECSVRTWAYVLARRALSLTVRERERARRTVAITPAVADLVAQVRSETPEYARTAARERLARLRRTLRPEDRMLLILRVNRRLPWLDVARVLYDDDAPDAAELERRAAGHRKHFERLKAELRERLAGGRDDE
jgi:RNA polymerase sigma-70 factor (ECF subfamily)